MTDRCPTRDRPTPTSELLAHASGCTCDGCEAACFGRCEPHDWRGEALRLRDSCESAWHAVAEQHRLAEEARADVARLREALATLHETACGVHPQWDSAQEKRHVYEFNVARNAAQEALAATDPETVSGEDRVE